MSLFFAFVILINAAALIAAGYLLWNLGTIFDGQITEAIRKQDDRLRKRFQGSANGHQETETEAPQSGQQQANSTPAKAKRQAGRPYRR